MSASPALPASPAAALKANPGAAQAAVYVGRHHLGSLVEPERAGRRGPRSTVLAFDQEDRFVGEFATGTVAIAALAARDQHDREAGR